MPLKRWVYKKGKKVSVMRKSGKVFNVIYDKVATCDTGGIIVA